MNRRQQILAVLDRADCTSSTVARLIGMCPKKAASKLAELYRLGAITREQGDSTGGRPPYLYSIKKAA